MSADNIPLLPCPWCQSRCEKYGTTYVRCSRESCIARNCAVTPDEWNWRAPDPVREKLVAVIREIEWDSNDLCPWCDCKRRRAHAPDCRIKLALQRTTP